ncbi:type II toxin-antitoxin system RelE/ParE family toxin [Prosthecobacter sp. SYSU 5D2]|uniref:type II toxin-antitoxin system RelE/ParE family toxin n=1 Tax=Prosthecobacter sp. SYSU 5D2 TaxID=3134134 RepID=UPI0031FE908F
MGSTSFHVRLTDSALNDLYEIDDYWSLKGEPERGEQYVRNLMETAERELSSLLRAQSGRLVRVAILPETRELLVFKGSYKIIYRVNAAENIVHILRFWHSHRDEVDLGQMGGL